MFSTPTDDRERRLATTTFDRNVVVTAGAGTGKTTLLVERCVNLLMREPDPVQMRELVALTFTNKAANEIRERLRERLEILAPFRSIQPSEVKDNTDVDTLRERYTITPEDIHRRAREALRHIEQAQIGTIHSFAASLLRLYPLEAGLDPQYREDDGSLLKRHFETEWSLWLDEELSGKGPRTSEWQRFLGRFPLDRLRSLTMALCAENVDLTGLRYAGSPSDPTDPVGKWLTEMDDKITDLITRHPKKRQIEQALAIARNVTRTVKAESPSIDPEELKLLRFSSAPKDWAQEDSKRARDLITDAQALMHVDPSEIDRLCALLLPFALQFREHFSRNGLVTFDGLLVRARDLLRDHPRICEDLAGRFKAILVDEFQDTDPLQYEILLWLCEARPRRSANWRDIRLTPGKLFVVGDPKQSVYGFRGADINAYLQVVKEVIEAQNGVEYRLTANFRSDPRILDVVNGIFEHLIREERGLQPEYIPLQSGLNNRNQDLGRPERSGGSTESTRSPVSARHLTRNGGTPDAEEARWLEAESLAGWLEKEVLGRTLIEVASQRVPVEPGHVAFLMRTLSHVQVYLEALRRRGIGYVVEGERDFYAAQEVIDAVNVLRVVDNPHDRVALVGVLRSPVGGCDDAEIFALSEQHLLDYRLVSHPRRVDLPRSILDLYQRLFHLHRDARFLETGKAVEQVFKELSLPVLAASKRSGQQAVANLEKLRLVAQDAGTNGTGALRDVVAELERRVRDRENESENLLEEETLDAVRIMSIHRAKGLEFPVVVLVDALAGVNRQPATPVVVKQDWTTGLTGIRIDDLQSLPGVFLQAKQRERETHEQRRLLYVAMTRPQQQLVVSFADRVRQDGDSMVSMIDKATGGALVHASPPFKPCGKGEIAIEVVTEDVQPDQHGNWLTVPTPDNSDWSWYENLWTQRHNDYNDQRTLPLILTPTRLKAAGETAAFRPGSNLRRETALALGELAHKILEHWNFKTQRIKEDLDEAIKLHTPDLPPTERGEVIKELKDIWGTLEKSPVYKELCSAQILGREMPFLIPWDGRIMEGVIDLAYKWQGQLYVADYKTDHVDSNNIAGIKRDYHHQARIYTEAVSRSLNCEVTAFRLIFLRLGVSADVLPERNSE